MNDKIERLANIIHVSELCKKGNADYQWSIRRQRKNDLAQSILDAGFIHHSDAVDYVEYKDGKIVLKEEK